MGEGGREQWVGEGVRESRWVEVGEWGRWVVGWGGGRVGGGGGGGRREEIGACKKEGCHV